MGLRAPGPPYGGVGAQGPEAGTCTTGGHRGRRPTRGSRRPEPCAGEGTLGGDRRWSARPVEGKWGGIVSKVSGVSTSTRIEGSLCDQGPRSRE